MYNYMLKNLGQDTEPTPDPAPQPADPIKPQRQERSAEEIAADNAVATEIAKTKYIGDRQTYGTVTYPGMSEQLDQIIKDYQKKTSIDMLNLYARIIKNLIDMC